MQEITIAHLIHSDATLSHPSLKLLERGFFSPMTGTQWGVSHIQSTHRMMTGWRTNNGTFEQQPWFICEARVLFAFICSLSCHRRASKASRLNNSVHLEICWFGSRTRLAGLELHSKDNGRCAFWTDYSCPWSQVLEASRRLLVGRRCNVDWIPTVSAVSLIKPTVLLPPHPTSFYPRSWNKTDSYHHFWRNGEKGVK